jgi:hypothetical protein
MQPVFREKSGLSFNFRALSPNDVNTLSNPVSAGAGQPDYNRHEPPASPATPVRAAREKG